MTRQTIVPATIVVLFVLFPMNGAPQTLVGVVQTSRSLLCTVKRFVQLCGAKQTEAEIAGLKLIKRITITIK